MSSSKPGSTYRWTPSPEELEDGICGNDEELEREAKEREQQHLRLNKAASNASEVSDDDVSLRRKVIAMEENYLSDNEVDEPCYTDFISRRYSQQQEESAARGGGSDGADSSGWAPIAEDPLAGDQRIAAGGGAPIIIPSSSPLESWRLVTPKTDSVTGVDFFGAEPGESGLLRDGVPEHLPCEDGVPFNESQADPITGGTPDHTGVNNIGGYEQVETNYGDVSDNHARGFIDPGNPETLSPLEFDVAVPLLTDKPVLDDQLEAVGANETCRQVGDPRTGISHMVCEQYMG